MKVALYCPLGSLNPESGLLFVLGRYLQALGHEVLELRCNGCISLCDRDSENEWQRSLDQCMCCEAECKQLGAWAGTTVVELSECISPATNRALLYRFCSTPTEDLWNASLASGLGGAGATIADVARPTFRARFAKENPDFNNRMHENVVRKLAFDALGLQAGLQSFVREIAPDLVLCSGAEVFLARLGASVFAAQAARTALFTWQFSERSIRISPLWSREQLLCGLLLERVSSMRNDTKTWPSELLSVLKEICQLLEIGTPAPVVARSVANVENT